ncbi:MAG: hypothetical protein E7598_06050 [Ruminococcaceae bacterium]|nr:hypothetical protein [Oscillospiraceae bacterium]
MTVNELVLEVSGNFEGEFFPNYSYLVCEYNRIIRTLLLMLPCADASVTLTPKDGKIDAKLLPEQVRRVFCDECELMAASGTLFSLMPEAKLYHAADDGIYVTVNGECTVFYRSLPPDVTDVDTLEAQFPLDARYIPLVRAWLMRSVYLYVGDFDGANAYGEEYNGYLDLFKRENGVRE